MNRPMLNVKSYMSNVIHKPVLLNEVIKFLDPKPGEFFIDGTLGSGGHAAEIIKRILPGGTLVGLDWDKDAVERARVRLRPEKDLRLILRTANYADLPEILEEENLGKADGLLLDLGMSSDQLEHSGRGFSFSAGVDEPLLMTYDSSRPSVAEILREISEAKLTEIIKVYGEERLAKKIARAIKARERIKPIVTVWELAAVIKEAVPKSYERGRINPATRTFQALRIYANRELDNLADVLARLPEIVKSGGRVAIISFHSLEDRLVKNHFRNYAKNGQMKILTKKPITAGAEELAANPRARSAKLRVGAMF